MQRSLTQRFAIVASVLSACLSLSHIATAQVPPPIPPPEPTGRDHATSLDSRQKPASDQMQRFASLRPVQMMTSGVSATNVTARKSTLTIVVETEDDAEPTLPEILKTHPLHSISLQKAQASVSIRDEPLAVPDNLARRHMVAQGSEFAPHVVGAPSLNHPVPVYHQPLYFEDPNLERCGAGFGILTEAVSAIRFFGRIPLAPYMAASQSPHDCVQSLGECKVCERYGKRAYLPPPTENALALEAAVIVGLVFLLP